MELFGVMALGILKIPKDQGLSMILAVHALQFMFIGAFGLWALHHEGFDANQAADKPGERMKKTFQIYWRGLAGFRLSAFFSVIATGLAGLLEGTALMFLIPILGQGMNSFFRLADAFLFLDR